jgi:hypothetical protein
MLRERFDQPGEKLNVDDRFAEKAILIVDGRGSSHDQYRIMAMLMIMRAISGAMRFG